MISGVECAADSAALAVFPVRAFDDLVGLFVGDDAIQVFLFYFWIVVEGMECLHEISTWRCVINVIINKYKICDYSLPESLIS